MNSALYTQKAIEAASVFLSEYKAHNMEYTRLLKLLYIADRESIAEAGDPMIGPKWIATKKGPLHGTVYDLIKSQTVHAKQWQKFFDTRDHSIYRTHDPGVGALSRGDVQIIHRIGEMYRSHDTWELIEETHAFKEWQDAFAAMDHKDSSTVISPEAVFKAVDMSDAFPVYVAQQQEIRLLQQAG